MAISWHADKDAEQSSRKRTRRLKIQTPLLLNLVLDADAAGVPKRISSNSATARVNLLIISSHRDPTQPRWKTKFAKTWKETSMPLVTADARLGCCKDGMKGALKMASKRLALSHLS